jgi:cysteine desulfurase
MDKKDFSAYVYADNAATTRLSDMALEAMLPYMTAYYGNPSSIYSFSHESRKALSAARSDVAAVLNADPSEIIFTSGGTESDNHAVVGAARANVAKGKHLITSTIEHHALLHTMKQLEKEGYSVTYVPVDGEGTIDVEALKAAVRPDTTVISIMMANNEVGTIQPIAEIGAFAKSKGILFHTDAVQAVGHIPVDVKELNVDMLSLSGHKFHGPKGVGALYLRKGVRILPLMQGGGQERGRRSGTENVAGAVGLAAALKEAASQMETEAARLKALVARLDEGILKIPYTKKTGHPTNRLPGLASYTVEFIEGESMILHLDIRGIAASTGSACSTGSLDPSHVLMAMGLTHEVAHGSLRLSLGKYSTDADVDKILAELPEVVALLRRMSPVWPGLE